MKSLQDIEDKYVARGLKGRRLKITVEGDKQYQSLLRKGKKEISKKVLVTAKDKKQYVLSTDADLEILEKVYALEKKKLSVADKELVRLVRSQLKLDWRVPLVRELNKLLKKYHGNTAR